MGRLPRWVAEFLRVFFEYEARVLGYLSLLTDRYPPAFDAEGYPIRFELPPPGRLSRWAVFFRIILSIPVAIVAGLAMVGWWVASFVIWLIVLVSGRYPSALFRATVAILRFYLRYASYLFLMTPRYPRGLFGDRPAPESAAVGLVDVPPLTEDAQVPPAANAATAGSTPTYPAPSYPGPGFAPTDGEPGRAAAGLEGEGPECEDTAGSRQVALLLTGAAKALVTVFLVLGVLGYSAAGAIAIYSAVNASPNRLQATIEVQTAYDRLNVTLQSFQAESQGCASGPDHLACVQTADAQLAAALETFKSDIDSVSPAGQHRYPVRPDEHVDGAARGRLPGPLRGRFD